MSIGGSRSAVEVGVDSFVVTHGTLVGGYRIERRLSSGGMAELFLARTPAGPLNLERPVVLKALPPVLADDYQWRSMFFNEARLAARLDHINLVRVFDLVLEEDRPYIVMEFLDGHNLREVMRRGPLPRPLACHVVAEVLAGLAYVHDRKDACGRPLGLVHRDVSPSNVMLTFAGAVKLIDFGIAKASESVRSDLTAAGQFKGKCCYSAPEQVRCRDVDRRSDLFAAGIMLWELLTGTRLFARGGEIESLRAILADPIAPVRTLAPDVPAALEAVVMRALERDVERRYQRAEEMRADLDEAVRAEGWATSSLSIERLMRARFAPGAAVVDEVEKTTVDATYATAALDDDELEIVVDDAAAAARPAQDAVAARVPSAAAGERDPAGAPADDEVPPTTIEAPPTTIEAPVLVAAALWASPDEPTRASGPIRLREPLDWRLVVAAMLTLILASAVTFAAGSLVRRATARPPHTALPHR